MILNAKTQLGLAFDKYMQDELFDLHYGKYLKNETDIEVKTGGAGQVKDLYSDQGNINYAFRQTAIDVAASIKLDQGKTEDLTFITDNLPVKKCTFLMGKNKFYRWSRWGEGSDIMVVCVKMMPPDDSVKSDLGEMNKMLNLPVPEIKKIINEKKDTGKISEYEYNFIMAAINNKDYKHQANNGVFYYLWGIKDGRLHFPPDERNEDFYAEMMEFTKLLIFTELSELETIILGPKQTTGTRKQGKWMNESNGLVRIVDSTWNKKIIKGDGFQVSGHRRLQPCGPGLRHRKLIWVDDFEKTGYTRNALKEA